jgi:hypothetical protein
MKLFLLELRHCDVELNFTNVLKLISNKKSQQFHSLSPNPQLVKVPHYYFTFSPRPQLHPGILDSSATVLSTSHPPLPLHLTNICSDPKPRCQHTFVPTQEPPPHLSPQIQQYPSAPSVASRRPQRA